MRAKRPAQRAPAETSDLSDVFGHQIRRAALLPNVEIPQVSNDRAAAARVLADALDGLFSGDATPSSFVGGRREGLRRLAAFDAARYESARNDVGENSGASRLSPYIRHGCVTLTEAKADAVRKIGADRAQKFLQELAWRQFWQLLRAKYGDRIHDDLEPAKVPLGRRTELPMDVETARTGLNCIDSSLNKLYADGYMENHARMWVAAYLVHHRKLDWKVGASLFYRFLLDGDPASNSLSWQWVASTFSQKPYFFNRQNVEKFSRVPATGATLCADCDAAREKTCPFDASYEALERRLFGDSYAANSPRNQQNAGRNRRGLAPRRSSF